MSYDLGVSVSLQRLGEHHAVRVVREVVLDRPLVDRDRAGAGTEPDTGDGPLAATGGLDERVRHDDLRYERFGACGSELAITSGPRRRR